MALINIKSLLDDDITKNQFLKERMKTEFEGIRIYDIYPFEYIYYNLKDRKTIIEEQKNIALYQPRIDYYELYEPIHHKLFNTDTDNLRFELLEDNIRLSRTQKASQQLQASRLPIDYESSMRVGKYLSRMPLHNPDVSRRIKEEETQEEERQHKEMADYLDTLAQYGGKKKRKKSKKKLKKKKNK